MRLDQRDSYLQRFVSRVSALEEGEDGTWVALDESAFYPTSGGQPHDTGRLGSATVTDVVHRDGAVWHRVEGPAPEHGAEVEGVIDWDRRYRHMQRHSAQHLLSQAFVRVSPAFETRSVSLRGADCTVDLTGDPDDEAMRSAETLVNTLAFAALPIVSFEVTEDEVGDYPLRRAPKVRGRIRLVAMGDVEVAACGGTHLASTAEMLPVKLLGSERVRGGLRRVTFRAGWDALEDYGAKHDLASGLIARFSAPLPELAERVARLEAERDAARAEVEGALRARAEDRAAALLGAAREVAGARVVRAAVEDALLEPLLEALARHDGVVALLGAASEERVRLAFARDPGGWAGGGPDVRSLLQAALPEIDGRGGGRPERAQGAGGRVAGLEAALDAAWRALVEG